jgi:hypothetical protein
MGTGLIARIVHVWNALSLAPRLEIFSGRREEGANDSGLDVLGWHETRRAVEGCEDPPLDGIPQVMTGYDRSPASVFPEEPMPFSPPELLQGLSRTPLALNGTNHHLNSPRPAVTLEEFPRAPPVGSAMVEVQDLHLTPTADEEVE